MYGSPLTPSTRRARRKTLGSAIAAALLISAGATQATDFVVTSSGDDVTPNDGFVTLREALMAANSNTDPMDTDLPMAGEADGDTISFNLAVPITITVLSELMITDDVVIDGDTSGGGAGIVVPGDGIMISGGDATRIFNVAVGDSDGDADDVTLADLRLMNGSAERGGAILNTESTLALDGVDIMDSEATGALATDGGGALYNDGGNVTATDGEMSGNTATTGSGSGGAVFNNGGSFSATGTEFDSNAANRAGGAIEDRSDRASTLTLVDVVMTNNNAGVAPGATAAPGNGGGVHLSGSLGAATITGGTFGSNVAALEGGALWNGSGTMDVDGGTFMANIASGDAADDGGGALFNLDGGTLTVANAMIDSNVADGVSGSGGGILNLGTLNVTDTTITDNVANRAGGGIEHVNGVATLSGVTFTGNNAGVAPATAAPGNGGAMHISGTGNASVTGGTIMDNVAALEGGGLWNSSGEMTVAGADADNRIMISGNTASGDGADEGGGGLFNNGGTLTVTDAMIVGNTADGTAGSGGGILSNGGSLSVSSSTIGQNTAVRAGGGIEVDASDDLAPESTLSLTDVLLSMNATGSSPGNGGGLHITGGNIAATISGGQVQMNTAAAEGGGLWNGSGEMTVDGTSITGNTASGADADQGGGGLFNAGGTLMVMNATVMDNVADGASGSGGGFLNDAGGSLTVMSSMIGGNTANRAGGGIEDNSSVAAGSVALTDTDVMGNTVNSNPGNGGGIHVTGAGELAITRGNIAGNSADNEGGGIWTISGPTTVTDVNIAGNSAPLGGGILKKGTAGSQDISGTTVWDNEAGDGGGLFSEGGDVTMTNSTISGNRATTGDGGGIKTLDGTVTLMSVTVADNTAGDTGGGADNAEGGDIVAMNTIFADNSATLGQDFNGTLTSQDWVLVENGKGLAISGPLTNVILGVDPDLDSLADNGGPTLTHALLEDSVAIDAGACPGLMTDQRGAPRDDMACDIGAYEAGGMGDFQQDLIFEDDFEGDDD